MPTFTTKLTAKSTWSSQQPLHVNNNDQTWSTSSKNHSADWIRQVEYGALFYWNIWPHGAYTDTHQSSCPCDQIQGSYHLLYRGRQRGVCYKLLAMLDALKKKISTAFKVKYFGELTRFIGREIKLERMGIQIAQQTYIQSLLKEYKVDMCNATSTSMATTADLLPTQKKEKELAQLNHALYRRQIGDLIYLSTSTRPDISFAVNALAKSVHAPSFRQKDHVRRIYCCLYGTEPLSIKFP